MNSNEGNGREVRKNFVFKSRFSVKPSKFSIFSALDCRSNVKVAISNWEKCMDGKLKIN